MNTSLAFGLALAGGSLWATSAAAAPENHDGWEIATTPYIWMNSIKGEVDVHGHSEDIDFKASFFDLLGDLNFAYMGSLNLRKGRFVAMTDTMIFHLSQESDIGSGGFAEAEVKQKLMVSSALAGYRVVDQDGLNFDLMAGLRRGSLKLDVELDGPFASHEASEKKARISPVIGARLNAPIADKWGIMVYGDASSLITHNAVKWQLLSTVHYQLSDSWRLGAGYRYMKFKSKGDVELEMAMKGPVIAFTHFW